MKRLLLGLMLLMTVGAASAAWTQSGATDIFNDYADRATIRRNGNLVKMWNLRDYKSMQASPSIGVSYLSEKVQLEYDCKEEKTRLLAYIWFSRQMGNGKVVSSDNYDEKWIPISPESIGETLWKIACGKK